MDDPYEYISKLQKQFVCNLLFGGILCHQLFLPNLKCITCICNGVFKLLCNLLTDRNKSRYLQGREEDSVFTARSHVSATHITARRQPVQCSAVFRANV